MNKLICTLLLAAATGGCASDPAPNEQLRLTEQAMVQARSVGASEQTPELAEFYPTSTLVTSRDIITLWVARMVLTGLYNVTQLGALEHVMDSGAGLALAGKFTLVILAVALAAQRDFAQIPLLRAALAAGDDPGAPLRAIARLDRIVLALALVIIWLGLTISRS